jgi:hypothetical protein
LFGLLCAWREVQILRQQFPELVIFEIGAQVCDDAMG